MPKLSAGLGRAGNRCRFGMALPPCGWRELGAQRGDARARRVRFRWAGRVISSGGVQIWPWR
jgi:hypothetical protein